MTKLVARVRTAWRSPLAWILLGAFLLRIVGIGWGLPSSDAWDVDGIAPRDFLPGLIETFTPGHYFTYPPAHLALLALLTSPVTAVLLARARSFALDDVLHEALKIPYMTSYSVVARLVSLAMSLGTVYAIAKIAEERAGRRAGFFAAGVCSVHVVSTYYAHTTNLDMPCVFWGVLALLALVRAIARGEPRRLRTFAALAALSVASKDQGYALFVLGTPLALALWVAADRARARAIAKEAAISVGIGAALLAIVDGALFNPSGFRHRLAFLAGPASQPHAYYSADALGRSLAALDTVLHWGEHYPWIFAPLVLVGIAIVVRDRGRRRAAALVPLLAAASFTVAFNCVARRTEHRFVMPQMVLWAVYAGIGLDGVFAWLEGRAGVVARAATGAAFAWGLVRCAAVDANLLLDPRYDAEAWLAAHVAPGDVVEVHGETVYLPRLPPQAHVVQVGPDPVATRNPVFGAEERVDRLGNVAARAPRFLVVATAYADHYRYEVPKDAPTSGRIRSGKQRETSTDADASSFFRDLFEGRLGYRVAHVSTWSSALWPRVDIHGSLARDVVVFERAQAEQSWYGASSVVGATCTLGSTTSRNHSSSMSSVHARSGAL